jgi:hypothetical protein
MKTNLSRRRLLASMPAVAAAGVPSVATALGGLAADSDPIFAAIEAHHDAMKSLTAAYNAQDDMEESGAQKGSAEWAAAETTVYNANSRHNQAQLDFLTTAPTTMAGILASLDHAASSMFPYEEGESLTVQQNALCAGCEGEELVVAAEQFPAKIAATLRKLLVA